MNRVVALYCAALCIAFTSVKMFAPETFPFLWQVKAAAFMFGGLALLFTNPDAIFEMIRTRIGMKA